MRMILAKGPRENTSLTEQDVHGMIAKLNIILLYQFVYEGWWLGVGGCQVETVLYPSSLFWLSEFTYDNGQDIN